MQKLRVRTSLGVNAALCVAVVSLASCSSSSTSDAGAVRTTGNGASGSAANGSSHSPEPSLTSDGATTTPAAGGGKITYSGAQSGSVQFDSAVCAVLGGEFEAIIAPDDGAEPDPKKVLTANHGQGQWTATFIPNKSDAEHSYVRNGADGMTAAEHNGVWTVTLSNTQLGLAGKAATVTLNGTLTCSRVAGT